MELLSRFGIPQAEDVPEFMFALEKARGDMALKEWNDFAKNSRILKKWRYFLSLDPYTRWAYMKPRGYPGDATLMDFAYRHRSIKKYIKSAGPIGELIYQYTSGAAQSESARQRISLIKEKITEQIEIRGNITILSVASGHARELEGLYFQHRSFIKNFTAIDTDAASLDEVRGSARDIPVTLIKKNILKIRPSSDLTSGDFVYSLGLFDYLELDHAVRVLNTMWKETNSKGVLIVANLAPDAANLGYCEAIMDWWMVPRSRQDMENLIAHIDCDPGEIERAKVYRKGCFYYLQVEKI